jgi:flavodoxin I
LKKIGLFFGSSSGKTAAAAMRIRQEIGSRYVDLIDVAGATAGDLDNYRCIIMGIPTWGIGELQDDWAGFLLSLNKNDYSDTRVALFGLGDQESYPDTFADAMGRLYDVLIEKRFRVVGRWPADGYTFEESHAYRDRQFVGLVLDEENQSRLSGERITSWVKQITREFE